MTLTPEQCRAFRAMARLTLEDMAEQTGIARQTIYRFENGAGEMQKANIEKMETVIERRGFDISNPMGVSRKAINTRIYVGRSGYLDFYDDIHRTARDKGGDICLYNGAPARILEVFGEEAYARHAARMEEIKDRYAFRVIVREGETSLIGAAFVEYRFVPAALFSEQTVYIYGDKVAFIDYRPDVRVLVIDEAGIAATQRVLFNTIWETKAKR